MRKGSANTLNAVARRFIDELVARVRHAGRQWFRSRSALAPGSGRKTPSPRSKRLDARFTMADPVRVPVTTPPRSTASTRTSGSTSSTPTAAQAQVAETTYATGKITRRLVVRHNHSARSRRLPRWPGITATLPTRSPTLLPMAPTEMTRGEVSDLRRYFMETSGLALPAASSASSWRPEVGTRRRSGTKPSSTPTDGGRIHQSGRRCSTPFDMPTGRRVVPPTERSLHRCPGDIESRSERFPELRVVAVSIEFLRLGTVGRVSIVEPSAESLCCSARSRIHLERILERLLCFRLLVTLAYVYGGGAE